MNLERSILSIVKNDLPNISRTFARVAKFLLESPEEFMRKTVQELSKATEVSEPTLIRFCRRYGYNGVPDFRIALALSSSSSGGGIMGAAQRGLQLEPSILDRSAVNRESKRAIAESAMSFIEEGQSIIVDSGSTMALFAEYLRNAPAITIFTTGLNVVETLWGCKQHKLMLPGGIVRFDASALTGRMVEASLKDLHFDLLFLGADSILPEVGLSTFNEDEAHQNRQMIDVASRLILLVDSSKFKQPALHRICSIDRIHAVITDNGLSEQDAKMLKNAGVKVIIADQ